MTSIPRAILPSQYLLFHPLEMPYIGAIGRGGSPSGVRVGLRSLLRASAGPTHDLARTPAFGSSGVSFHILGSLSPSLKILGIIPKKQTYQRAYRGYT